MKDWLGNTTSYTYADANYPNVVTKITYPSGTSLTATYGHDAQGNVTSLSAGSNITDAWTYNQDEQVKTTTINGSTSASVAYNANHQITAAANMATSTSNDTYTVAANGEIDADAAPGGSTVNDSYNAGDELCNSSTSSTSCSTPASTSTRFAYTTNGERASATAYSGGAAGSATYYAWNAYGQLCNVASAATACGSTPSSGASYQYNGDGERTITTTSTTTTDSTWDNVSAASIPLNVNDAATTSSGTTNTSYLYGNLLFGGTAPIEQISGTTATFLVANQTGVQGIYGSTGSALELAVYSTYGNQTISSGSKVTPFGFQGSYTDSTGLIYLINRFYDPVTDEFLSVDPDVATTNQPYVFTGDDPLNSTDPRGLAEYDMGSAMGMSGMLPGDDAVDGGAYEPESAVNAVKLNRQLNSESQMGEAGKPIAGEGLDDELRQAKRLSNEYGGNSEDYTKMTSSSYRGADGHQFQTRWYENINTGERFEYKTVFPPKSIVGYK